MVDLDKLAPALVALQANLTPVAKSATNPFFKSKYAPLPEVMESVQPLLAKHKLAIVQFPTNLDGVSALQTMLIHESGQTLQAAPQPLLMSKQDPQGQGSAMTYARRYGIMAVLGLVADEDDDGNKATKSYKPEKPDKLAITDQQRVDAAKKDIVKELREIGYDTAQSQILFIKSVISKETIDTLQECYEIGDAIDNARESK